MDYLSQAGVDAGRFALLVGHDFGGNVWRAGREFWIGGPRIMWSMAATPRFPDWYLHAPKSGWRPGGVYLRILTARSDHPHPQSFSSAAAYPTVGEEHHPACA